MTDTTASSNSQPASGWETHVTVATVVEDNGRYLMVEEYIDGDLTMKQPAGHLDKGESLIQTFRLT